MRLGRERSKRKRRHCFGQWRRKKDGRQRGSSKRRRRSNDKWRPPLRQRRSTGSRDGGLMSPWRNSSSINGGRRNGGRWMWKTRGHALAVGQGK